MIDAVSAIGLAASIMQLTTFIGQIISKSRELYESADGALVEHLELETVARSLNELTGIVAGKTSVAAGLELNGISELCREQSAELLEAFAKGGQAGRHIRPACNLSKICNQTSLKSLLR